MSEESVRKTAAKKTVRKAVGRTAAVKRAPRRRVATEVVSERVTAPRRKAPTSIPSQPRTQSRLVPIGFATLVLLIGLSALIGYNADGVINVNTIIESRIAAASPEERARLEQAQRATANKLPDGGLIPTGLPEIQNVPVATTSSEMTQATSTASSTGASASSTPEVLDGGLVPSE